MVNELVIAFIWTIAVFMPVLILIYFARKYFYQDESTNMYVQLSRVTILSIIGITLIIEIIVASTCIGDECIGLFIFPLYMLLYGAFLVGISIITGNYLTKKKKQRIESMMFTKLEPDETSIKSESVEYLRELKKLKDEKVLTENEFKEEKEKVLHKDNKK